jgi:hypothetical protein
MPYPGWNAKQIRQYKHIVDSTGSKSEAAATVNKLKAKAKKAKRKAH